MLDPKKVQQKADILENNLYQAIAKQTDPASIRLNINRKQFPDQVINKALLQLMPRFNIKPSLYILGLRDLMQKELKPDDSETFSTEISTTEEALYADDKIIARSFEVVITKDRLKINLLGVPPLPSIDGEIAKSYFDHKKSAGSLSKDGAIDFREINRYPIVNAGDKLFYITHEIQGKPGISFDGKLLDVDEARPLMIAVGNGVERIDDVDDKEFKSRGYHLEALKTGVVVIDWDKNDIPRSIEIKDEVEIKRLDYSIGNIGSQFTCPINVKVGTICSGFKIRVNGTVKADISEGAEVITNSDAQIALIQNDTTVIARKDISLSSTSGSLVQSEQGVITISNEAIDSRLEAPEILFQKTGGLLTNNRISTNKLTVKGPNFTGTNTIYFGTELFTQKDQLINTLKEVKNKLVDLAASEKELLDKLHIEIKKVARLTETYPDLTKHIKPVIIALKTMDFEIIFHEMDEIQKMNNTKPVFNARQLFEALEKIPPSTEVYTKKRETLEKQLRDIDRRMELLKLEIEGTLRKGSTIKVFCGSTEVKDKLKPDFTIDSPGDDSRYIMVKGSYSHQKGFEFVQ